MAPPIGICRTFSKNILSHVQSIASLKQPTKLVIVKAQAYKLVKANGFIYSLALYYIRGYQCSI